MARTRGWLLFFLFVAVSCLDEPDCFTLTNNIIGISFKKLFDGKADTVGVTLLRTDGVTFINKDTAISSVILPLNYFSNETSFFFEGKEKNCQLRLGYNSKVQFVSEDCGERFVVDQLTILDHSFDSIRVVNSTPGKGEGTHVEVYRCPRLNVMKVFLQRKVGEDTLANTENVSIVMSHYPVTISGSGAYFKIPLDTAAESSTIKFNFADGVTKSFVVQYSRVNKSVLTGCPSRVLLHKLVTSSTSDFSNPKKVKDSIQDPPITNFEIIH
jgi:hypothetical protein